MIVETNKLIANNMEIKVDDVKIKNSDYINKNDFIPSLSPKLTNEKIIFQKINELNSETLKFKEERNKITALKFEYEKLQKQLLNDIEDLNIKKEEFEKYKITEIEKIKRKKNMISNENNSNKNANINFNINNHTKSNKRMLNNGNFLNNELFDRDIIINVHNEINNIKYLNNLNEKEKKTNTEIRIKNTKKKKLVNINKNKLNNNQTIGKKRKRKN